MEKKECSRCKRLVPAAPRCLYCGQSLVAAAASAMDRDEILTSTLARALAAHRDQAGRELARMTVYKSLPGGMFPGLKKVVVAPGRQAVICADVKEPILLGPGTHNVSRAGGPAGPLQGLLAAIRGGFLTVCDIDTTSLFASFVLPDLPTLREYQLFDGDNDNDVKMCAEAKPGFDPRLAFKAAYSSQNLRTADDLLGGAELQLRLRCIDPLRLQTNLILSHEEFRDHEKRWAPEQKAERAWMLARVLESVSSWWARTRGDNRPKDGEDLPAFSFYLRDLYARLRAELEMAVRAAVLNERVEELYNTVTVRERVKSDIARAMAQSLDLFGIQIDDVVAFQFSCPDYEALRVQRGQTVIERGELQEQRERRDLERERRQITSEDLRESMTHEASIERHQVTEQAESSQVRDAAAAAEEARLRERRTKEKGFEREQLAADVRQQLQLADERERQAQMRTVEKVRALAEIHGQHQEATFRRQVEWARTVAELGLASDSILAVMLQSKPELASVLVEMKRQAGLQQMLAMKDQFEQRFIQVLGQDRQQISRLMDEAVRQFGNVMAKRAEATRPQIVPAGLLHVSTPPPADPKNDASEAPGV